MDINNTSECYYEIIPAVFGQHLLEFFHIVDALDILLHVVPSVDVYDGIYFSQISYLADDVLDVFYVNLNSLGVGQAWRVDES